MNDGSGYTIRPAAGGDAAAFLDLKVTLDAETDFMMLEPGERRDTPEALAAHLDRVAATGNSVILVADLEGRLGGYVEAEGGTFRRNRHSAYVVIGVRREASGRGIGRRLLGELDRWAIANGLHRLELTVMAHNERAITLYRSCGYEVDGRRRDSLRVGGSFVDELSLAKLL